MGGKLEGGTTQGVRSHDMDFADSLCGVLSGMTGGEIRVGMNRNIFTFCV